MRKSALLKQYCESIREQKVVLGKCKNATTPPFIFWEFLTNLIFSAPHYFVFRLCAFVFDCDCVSWSKTNPDEPKEVHTEDFSSNYSINETYIHYIVTFLLLLHLK